MQRNLRQLWQPAAFAQRGARWLRLPAALASLTVVAALTSTGVPRGNDTTIVTATHITDTGLSGNSSFLV